MQNDTAIAALSRRQLLLRSAATSLLAASGVQGATAAPSGQPAVPFPLGSVRLLPSPYASAVDANLKYLLSLSADRFLHNYHKFAGLPVKGELYGGWESDTIAGEGLGHYLSALALMYAQTGTIECKTRISYIVAELAKVQKVQGDGYVAGFLRKRKDGTIVDGKEIFKEIVAGDIRSYGFDLNGAWSPLYNLHKVFAGLLDAHELVGNVQALEVALGLGSYLDKVFAALDDKQTEAVLGCEYGGLNESFAELYARTKDGRWLRLAERIYDHKVLDAVVAGKDELQNKHSNTQIPKVIGLARIAELTSHPDYARGAAFFFDTVTHHHSYVIGGNGDREYFFAPDTIADHLSEQTCEHCASYNMLKLARHLFAWKPDGALFDYYERTHLNHILAAQNPKTGMFTYMTPMLSGAERGFSSPDDGFWCCVLSGMESHAKHGDSIYWRGAGKLYVNLYIPSQLDWHEQRAKFELQTRYPYEGKITLVLKQFASTKPLTIAMRIPAWAGSAAIAVNGKAVDAPRERGYALISRRWKTGDTVTLDLPLDLRLEAAAGNEKVVSICRGPMVLAADLGPADKPFDGYAPALVGAELLQGLTPVSPQEAVYRTRGIGRPDELTFRPFYSQWEQRSAVYFNRYSEPEWSVARAAFLAEQARQKDIAARSVDILHIGEMQPEHDHNLQADQSYPGSYRGRNCRDVRFGGYLSFEMKAAREGKPPGPLVLSATYWGSETGREFDILVDGVVIAHQVLSGKKPNEWLDIEYPVPEKLTKGKSKITIRFEPKNHTSAGPIFGVVLFAAKAI
jgi:uncharacterized protein